MPRGLEPRVAPRVCAASKAQFSKMPECSTGSCVNLSWVFLSLGSVLFGAGMLSYSLLRPYTFSEADYWDAARVASKWCINNSATVACSEFNTAMRNRARSGAWLDACEEACNTSTCATGCVRAWIHPRDTVLWELDATVSAALVTLAGVGLGMLVAAPVGCFVVWNAWRLERKHAHADAQIEGAPPEVVMVRL